MEHTTADINTEIVADGIIGLTFSTLAHFTPQIFCGIVYAINGITVHRIDEGATALFHVLSAIIATVTVADIVYKKYKAHRGNKSNK